MSSSCKPRHLWRSLPLFLALVAFTAPEILFAQRRSAATRKPAVEGRIPPVVRAVYLPMRLLQEDPQLTGPLFRNLNDIAANLVVLELSNKDAVSSAPVETSKQAALSLVREAASSLEDAKIRTWIAIGPNESVQGRSVPGIDGVLFRLSRSSDGFSTSAHAQQSTSTCHLATVREQIYQLPPQLSAGVQFTMKDWEESATATRGELVSAADLLCPDLVSFNSPNDPPGQSTSKRLEELPGAQGSVRIAPSVELEVAIGREDLESAIRGCIESVGGALVVLPPVLPEQEMWDAIRRGFETSYLLPEG